MRALACIVFLLVATHAVAQPPPEELMPLPKVDDVPPPPDPEEAPAPPREHVEKKQDMSAPDAWQPRQLATLRVMNKIDSTVQVLTVAVGAVASFESLTIRLSGCFVRPPDLPADAAAHLTITDSRPGLPGFDAWMLKNEPALNMLEHPVYDVQLAACG